MPLPKSRLLASVPKQPNEGVDVPVLDDAPASPIPKIHTRADRPPTHPAVPKSNNDMRKWVREQLALADKKSRKKLDSTMEQYRKKYRRIEEQRDENGLIPVSALGDNKDSHYVNSAAIHAASTERARAALSEISRANTAYTKAKNAGDTALAQLEKSNEEAAYAELIYAANDIATYPIREAGTPNVERINTFKADKKTYKDNPSLRGIVYEKPQPLPDSSFMAAAKSGEINVSKKPSRSKRNDMARIQKLRPDWRNQAFDSVAEKWKPVTAVASVTGCRPEEITGITITRDSNDPSFLVFTIKGAKTNQGHGIKERKIAVREHGSNAFDFLHGLTAEGEFTVRPPTLKDGKELKDIKAAFRNAVNEAGRRFIMQRKDAPTLSPYCFRHSMGCDLKAEGHDMTVIAIVLGHSTTKTQRTYGNSKNGVRNVRELKVDVKPYDIKQNVRTPISPTPAVSMEVQASPQAPAPEDSFADFGL